MKSITNMPLRTPNTYGQAEIGYSSSIFRDIKAKIGLLKHILQDLGIFQKLVLTDMDYKHPWITDCLKHHSFLEIFFENPLYATNREINKTIQAKSQASWKENFSKKSSLAHYRQHKPGLMKGLTGSTPKDAG